MKGSRRRSTRGRLSRPSWPSWLEPLRPDDLTRRRIQAAIMAHAERILPGRSWYELTSRWSTVLAPLAAGLAVAFGTMAYRASAGDPPSIATGDARVVDGRELDSGVLGPFLTPDIDGPPSLLIDVAEPSRESLLAAVLVSR